MAFPKEPRDMSLDELKMLIEYRKLELKLEFQEVRHNLGIGTRILKAIQKSGILKGFQESLLNKTHKTDQNDSINTTEDSSPIPGDSEPIH